MALSKAMLKGMGLTEDQISGIIEGHMDSVKALQDDVKKEKERADSYQKELDNSKDDGWKDKYEAEKKALEKYKQETEEKALAESRKALFADLLAESGLSSKGIEKALKYSDISSVEVEEGKIKDAESLLSAVKEEWADYITQVNTTTEKVETPPESNAGSVTKEQFDKMSYRERLNLYNENQALYSQLKGE